MNHHDYEHQWMCAACGWIHHPIQQGPPDECENCGHRATLMSWIQVKWLDWYSQWQVIA